MPLTIDHKDEKGNVTKGLWDSHSDVLGNGSFESCWSVFHASGKPFGLDTELSSFVRRTAIAPQQLQQAKT
jgi:hypothetical protein